MQSPPLPPTSVVPSGCHRRSTTAFISCGWCVPSHTLKYSRSTRNASGSCGSTCGSGNLWCAAGCMVHTSFRDSSGDVGDWLRGSGTDDDPESESATSGLERARAGTGDGDRRRVGDGDRLRVLLRRRPCHGRRQWRRSSEPEVAIAAFGGDFDVRCGENSHSHSDGGCSWVDRGIGCVDNQRRNYVAIQLMCRKQPKPKNDCLW